MEHSLTAVAALGFGLICVLLGAAWVLRTPPHPAPAPPTTL